jgi:hypothetical protein
MPQRSSERGVQRGSASIIEDQKSPRLYAAGAMKNR